MTGSSEPETLSKEVILTSAAPKKPRALHGGKRRPMNMNRTSV